MSKPTPVMSTEHIVYLHLFLAAQAEENMLLEEAKMPRCISGTSSQERSCKSLKVIEVCNRLLKFSILITTIRCRTRDCSKWRRNVPILLVLINVADPSHSGHPRVSFDGKGSYHSAVVRRHQRKVRLTYFYKGHNNKRWSATGTQCCIARYNIWSRHLRLSSTVSQSKITSCTLILIFVKDNG